MAFSLRLEGCVSLGKWDVLVLGAGASGLMCALEAARRGRRTAVADHAARVGRKLRLTGGGKCNFTNLDVSADNYLSGNPHFCKSALARFNQYAAMDLLATHGIAWEEREHGRLFCLGGAGEIAGLLTTLCKREGVEFLLERAVRGACRLSGQAGPGGRGKTGGQDRPDEAFRVATDQGDLAASSLVVATGGPAWPQAGATGIGLDIARSFGLAVVSPRPALVPLVMAGDWPLAGLAGLALPVTVRIGDKAFSDHLLFTHKGLSGPAALQASLYWRPGLELVIDFLPGAGLSEFLDGLPDRKVKLRNALARLFPARLAAALCGPGLGERSVAGLTHAEREAVLASVHAHTVTPQGTEGFTKAEVTAGGVDTRELSSKTMEAKNVPGLFFIGEVVDVTGWLGGYNLQWAWASGFAAGQHA